MTEPTEDPKAQFESIRQINPYGEEYWSARELAPLLGYERWERFAETIQRAKEICTIAGIVHEPHFLVVPRTVSLGSGAQRDIVDYHLSRYGLHLVFACADIRKPATVRAIAYITLTSLAAISSPQVATYARNVRSQKHIAITQEQKTIGVIMRAFQHIPCVLHYRVFQSYWAASYYVDLYFPDHRIAVECDEEGHHKYDKANEELRQSRIEHTLGCRFVRFNPDDPAFNLGDVINQIMLLIYGQAGLSA